MKETGTGIERRLTVKGSQIVVADEETDCIATLSSLYDLAGSLIVDERPIGYIR